MKAGTKIITVAALLLLLVLGTSISIRVRTGENSVLGKKRNQVEITTSESGRTSVRYKEDGITYTFPSKWSPMYWNSVDKGFSASYRLGNHTTLGALIDYKQDDPSGAFEGFVRGHPDYVLEKIEIPGYTTYSYYSQTTEYVFDSGDGYAPPYVERIPGGLGKTYLAGKLFLGESNNPFVRIECYSAGPDYANLISDCNEFVDSLKVR